MTAALSSSNIIDSFSDSDRNAAQEIRLDSSEHSVKKRALPALIAVAPLFSAIFGAGSFAYGIANGQQRLSELRNINKKLDKLQQSVDVLNGRVKSLQLGQQWLEGATLYAKDVQRLRFILHQMKDKVKYCDSKGELILKTKERAQEWADTVLDDGPDGLEQIMFSMHDLVMGTERLFGKRSLISIYKDQLIRIHGPQSDVNPGTYTQDIEDFVEYIMALETGGYAAIATAMNIKQLGSARISAFIEDTAKERMVEQWEKVTEIVGVPQSWRGVSTFAPPFHVAADGHGDLGARFVDLNGDGKIDMVYHRWINGHTQQKGAYLNNGNGWTWAAQYTPPFHIAADGYGDLGARFVDLNGDGKMDMVYHRWINGHTQQKGAYLNNGNGWTWAAQYTPPFHIAADGYGDLGARFVDLNGDGKIDMVYHRWINGHHQQKGAYLNNGNGWTWAAQYTPPFHIAADGHGDLGARFVDLNGDGKIDMVYHRWINGHHQQKGAYLNNGNGWTWAAQYTPPFHIAADGYGDLGARFVDLNGDGKMDMVYHRWINGHTQQKGAYLNNGNGWTWAAQYTPPFHIAADGYGDLGARFVDLNGDGKMDMVYHRWINGHHQQKGAYLNNGNGWTWAARYTPPFHIAADGYGDLGARFVDLNGDGNMDLVYHRWINSNIQQKGAFLALDFYGDHLRTPSFESSTLVETC